MGLQDLVVTPFYLVLLYALAYWIRPRVTNRDTRKYFIPGLTVKFIGAISLGLVYQFYYGGGDTMNYYHLGSKWVWEAFLDSPSKALSLIFAGAQYPNDAFQYATRIYFFGDLPSYFVVRLAGFFGILSLNSYYSIALFFGVLSFIGTWALYHALYKMDPRIAGKTAFAVLFIPSVFFWGSGVLKDGLTFSAMGIFIFCLLEIVVWRKRNVWLFLFLLISAYLMYHIKVYIALSLLPGAILFVYFFYFGKLITSKILKMMLLPVMLLLVMSSMYYAAYWLGEDDRKYSMDAMFNTAQVSAEWLYYVSQQQDGSAYALGDSDFSPAGMLRKFFPGVWVSMFRPYLWEVKNSVMLLTAVESLALFVVTGYIIWKVGIVGALTKIARDPLLLFFLVFTFVFSFAIGVSTFNFGTLARYRIPMLPMFVFSLFYLFNQIQYPQPAWRNRV